MSDLARHEMGTTGQTRLYVGMRLRIFNAAIEERRRALGLTMVALARKSGVDLPTLYAIKGFRKRPSVDYAVRIAAALDLTLEDIWPDWLESPLARSWTEASRRVSSVEFVSLAAALSLPETRREFLPEQMSEVVDLRRLLDAALTTLQEREQRVIRLRFGLDDDRPRTQEEIGLELGLSKGCIGQIEAKALRKLQHPTRTRLFRDYSE